MYNRLVRLVIRSTKLDASCNQTEQPFYAQAEVDI